MWTELSKILKNISNHFENPLLLIGIYVCPVKDEQFHRAKRVICEKNLGWRSIQTYSIAGQWLWMYDAQCHRVTMMLYFCAHLMNEKAKWQAQMKMNGKLETWVVSNSFFIVMYCKSENKDSNLLWFKLSVTKAKAMLRSFL